MNEMKRTAKTLDKVFKVVKKLLDVGLIILLVGLGILVVGLIFDQQAEQAGNISRTIELGFVELELMEAYAPDQQAVLLSSAVEILIALAYLWAARIAVRHVREILKPMVNGEPFSGIVSAKLGQLASLSLLVGIMENGMRMAQQVIIPGIMDLENLLLSEKIAGISFNYELDLTFLLVFAALKLLVYVFRYGEELQKNVGEKQ